MTTTAMTITDDQIETLRAEAGQAGDLAQVAICDRALGHTLYEVVAQLPDGQVMRDEGHISEYAGHLWANRDEAELAADNLDDERPEGHESVAYVVREADLMTAVEARAACARVISDAQ